MKMDLMKNFVKGMDKSGRARPVDFVKMYGMQYECENPLSGATL
jgi:hypothetical protein